MTVSPSRTVDNATDVGRKIPTTALADRVLTAKEGTITEEVAGVGIAGVVALSQPACPGSPVYILVHDGAGAFPAGGAAPAAVPVPVVPTHFTLVESNANGVAELTEAGGRDYSGLTLRISYSPDQAEGTIGGQSSAVLTDI